MIKTQIRCLLQSFLEKNKRRDQKILCDTYVSIDYVVKKLFHLTDSIKKNLFNFYHIGT